MIAVLSIRELKRTYKSEMKGTWYCPDCEFGPLNPEIDAVCPRCSWYPIAPCKPTCSETCLRVNIAFSKSYQRTVLHRLSLHLRDNDGNLLSQIHKVYNTRHGFFKRYFSFKALQSIEVRKYNDHLAFFDSSNIELAATTGPSRFVTLEPYTHTSSLAIVEKLNRLCPHLTYELLHSDTRPKLVASQRRWIQIVAALGDMAPSHTLYLHEDLSTARVGWNVCAWVLLSTMISVVWTAVRGGDMQSGLALGSYLIALGAFAIGGLAYIEMRNEKR